MIDKIEKRLRLKAGHAAIDMDIYKMDTVEWNAADLIVELVGYIEHLMEGDTYHLEEMYGRLRQQGYVDEDGFFIWVDPAEVGR